MTEPSRSLAAIMRGTSIALLGSIVGGGFGFLFTVVMARLLGRAEFGVLVLALNVITFGAALGIAGADYGAIRFIAAAPSPGRKRGAFLTPFLLALALDVVLAALIAIFAAPISRTLLTEETFEDPLRALALVLPLTVAAQMFSAGLSGLERTQGELARKVVEQGGRLLLAPLAVVVGLGVTGAVLGLAAAAAAAAIVVGLLLRRALPRGGKTERIAVREVVDFAWPQAAANLVALSPVALAVIVSHYDTSRAVGLLGAAVAIALLPGLVYNAFSFRFSPTIARLYETGQHDELRALLLSVTRWITVVSLPLYTTAIVFPSALLQIYGPGYREAAATLALISAASLVNAVAGPVEWALIMTGRVRLELVSNAVGVTVLIGTAVPLVAHYGLVGAGLALVVFTLAMNASKLFFVWRTLSMTTLSLTLLRPIAACALAAAGVYLLERWLSLGSSIPGAIALGALLLAAYGGMLLAIGISEEDRGALRLALGSPQPEGGGDLAGPRDEGGR